MTTPFLWAVYFKYTDIIKLLLFESIVKVDLESECFIPGTGAGTVLTLAIAQKNVRLVALLLQGKADPSHNPRPQNNAYLPINMALRTGNVSICSLLLDAFYNYPGKPAWSIPGEYTTMHGSLEILQLLVKHGAKISDDIIKSIVIGRYPHLLEYCLEHEYQRPGNEIQWNETTMISLMRIILEDPMKQCDERCFAVLLQWGIYTARTPVVDNDEEFALYTAANAGAIQTMRMLVELRPSRLQKRWLVEGRIPPPPAGFSFTFNLLEHNIKACQKFAVTLIEARKNPCLLMILCRAKIIQSLGYKPFAKVPELPLPMALKDFVMLKNIEGY